MPRPLDPSPVLLQIVAGVATVTLADDANRNALSLAMVDGLLEAIAQADADPTVRVLVLTNRGSAFCAGADLREQSGPTGRVTGASRFDQVLRAIQTSRVPVVGRIDGHAVAGGVGLAAVCDISIARDDVLLGFTEVRVGAIPAVISVVCLPKMRRGDALETFLRGQRFSAVRAVELGLINQAVPAAELDGAVEAVVEDLLLGAPRALGSAKALVYDVPALPSHEALAIAAARSAEVFAGEEATEGRAAYLEKRRPSWVAQREQTHRRPT